MPPGSQAGTSCHSLTRTGKITRAEHSPPNLSIMLTEADLDRIASFPMFESVPRAELAWLGARGEVVRLAGGVMLADIGSEIDEMWIVLSGAAAVHAPKGPGGTFRKFYDSGPGAVLGAMPYSRMRNAPARLVIEEDTVLCSLGRSHFQDLVRDCPELTSALVHQMLDRTRDYRTAQL